MRITLAFPHKFLEEFRFCLVSINLIPRFSRVKVAVCHSLIRAGAQECLKQPDSLGKRRIIMAEDTAYVIIHILLVKFTNIL